MFRQMAEVSDVSEEYADREEGFAGKNIYDAAADVQQKATGAFGIGKRDKT